MTLPDESRDVFGKGQDIWNWLVHPPQNGDPPPYLIGLKCQPAYPSPIEFKALLRLELLFYELKYF